MHFIGITKAEDNFCEFGFSDAYITMEKDFDTANILAEALDYLQLKEGV